MLLSLSALATLSVKLFDASVATGMGSDLTEREEVKYKLKPSMMREILMNSFEFNHHAGLALSHGAHHSHDGQRAGG